MQQVVQFQGHDYMGINKYYEIVVADFEIMGEYRNEWENYEFGKDYQAFAVHKKNTKFEV